MSVEPIGDMLECCCAGHQVELVSAESGDGGQDKMKSQRGGQNKCKSQSGGQDKLKSQSGGQNKLKSQSGGQDRLKSQSGGQDKVDIPTWWSKCNKQLPGWG